MKSGFIGIIGRPNVGKSTLLNKILGEKIAITSEKAQTTRNRIKGIYTEIGKGTEDVQMIFLDTPGIHKPKNKLGNAINETAMNTYRGVDVALLVIDGSKPFGRGDEHMISLIKDISVPRILIINKIDLISPEEYIEIYEKYIKEDLFDDVFGISALNGTNVSELIENLKKYMLDGPMYFPDDISTDSPMRFLVSEIIREKILMYLEQEIPHGVAVEIEEYEEGDSITRIGAVIICENPRHKSIIIGKGGRKIKGIGKSARLEIEELVGTKVFLNLWVKVKDKWRDSDTMIKNLGFKDE